MKNDYSSDDTIYDHYIAIDWSAINMAIARMTKKANKITVIDVPSDVTEMKVYLKSLKGSKILAFEETTTSQWLYTELKDYADKIFICDPHRNRLLSEGPKTDKIDAVKLVKLLRSNLMKEVYHSGSEFLYLRRMVSGYEDLVQSGVRMKNQRYSILRACGNSGYEEKEIELKTKSDQHVLSCMDRQISLYEQEKKGYIKELRELSKKHKEIRDQRGLPGIDVVNAVKIVARVVSPYRFKSNGHYLSYAGLIKLDRISGGRSYGRKEPRYSRQLKSAYKTAVITAIGGNNEINDYYEHLIRDKRYSEHNARSASCRKLAILSMGVLKSGKKYQPYRRLKKERKLVKA